MNDLSRIARAVLVVLALAACGCGGRRSVGPKHPQPLPVRTAIDVGACADPTTQGMFGPEPNLRHADRDLDGDGVNELVVSDRELCTTEGNCHWNLYRRQGECYRYLGTVSAASLQRVTPRGEEGFYGLRGWWKLSTKGRVLLQEYRFRGGGYRLVDALLCRQAEDDRMECAEQGR